MTANKDKHAYKLLSGETVSLGWLNDGDMVFLETLKEHADEGEDYFSLIQRVRGRGSYVLYNFDGKVTEEATQTVLFRVANDIVERAGIRQGRLFHQKEGPDAKNLMTTAQACEVMGITRSGLHFLLTNGKIKGWKIGKLWLVDRESAEGFRK